MEFTQEMNICQKKHSACIINLDDLGNQGTHWVCCFPSITFGNTLNYFDSFGIPCPEEYAKRAKKDKLQIIYNTSQYQELTSVLCGYYCLFFCIEQWFSKKIIQIF